MAGRGRTPKASRQRPRDNKQRIRGDWTEADGGWQHGEAPEAPDGLLAPSRKAWETWMAAWFAAHWTPEDLPGLRQVIRLYDQVERGEFQRASELRLSMDTYGITPKGQQDRRWTRPKADEEERKSQSQRQRAVPDQYAHLKVVNE